MRLRRGTKILMLLLVVFLLSGLVIDGKYSSVSAGPQKGKQAGMSKERPEVDRSGLPQMSIPMATQAGTVMQMSNCAGSADCIQGDWINNNWLVYHNRDDDHIYKTDGVSNVILPWSGGSECDSHPDVNNAGSLIALQRRINDGSGNCSELWVMDINGTNQRRIIPCSSDVGGAHEPKWSPDGMYIAYTQGVLDHEYKDLMAVGYPSGAPIRLTNRLYANPQHGLQWLATTSRRSSIPVSPVVLSSQKLWVDTDGDGDIDYSDGYTRDIARNTLWGGTTWLTSITDDWCELMPVPTLTGKIVYMSDIGDYGDVYIMNQDGTNKTRLTDSSDRSYCSNHPEPTPNGKYIAFWSEDGDGYWRIWMMTADGRYKGVVVDGPEVNNQEWSYRTLKFNPLGTKLLFTGCTTPYSYYCDGSNVYSLSLDMADTDADKLKNFEEAIYGTNPLLRDTDGGGEDDYSETVAGRDPLNPADDRRVVTPIAPGVRATP